jgi:hypothetical protein
VDEKMLIVAFGRITSAAQALEVINAVAAAQCPRDDVVNRECVVINRALVGRSALDSARNALPVL